MNSTSDLVEVVCRRRIQNEHGSCTVGVPVFYIKRNGNTLPGLVAVVKLVVPTVQESSVSLLDMETFEYQAA